VSAVAAEPFSVTQTGPLKGKEAQAWIEAQARIATDAGARWQRVTKKDDGSLLHEAWETRPEDEGKPRWAKKGKT